MRSTTDSRTICRLTAAAIRLPGGGHGSRSRGGPGDIRDRSVLHDLDRADLAATAVGEPSTSRGCALCIANSVRPFLNLWGWFQRHAATSYTVNGPSHHDWHHLGDNLWVKIREAIFVKGPIPHLVMWDIQSRSLPGYHRGVPKGFLQQLGDVLATEVILPSMLASLSSQLAPWDTVPSLIIMQLCSRACTVSMNPGVFSFGPQQAITKISSA